jgi:hypothetical protein
LSDKRPAHAFYEFKTPDTITAVGSHHEQNPQVAIAYFARKVLVVICVAAFSLLSAVTASAASLSVGPGTTLSRTK